MKAIIFALVIGLCATSVWSASTACEGYSPERLGSLFDNAIQLNQRFKQLATNKESDDAAYAAARKKNAEFAEVHALPCLERATMLLLSSSNRTLLGKVISLADSYENMADEGVSEALALLYVAQPDAFEAAIKSRSRPSRSALLKRTEEGLERQGADIGRAIALDRAKRLKRLRARH